MLFPDEGYLYPDSEPPEAFADLPARVDFIARLSAAWDFGVLPFPETIDEIRHPAWREAVDACRLLTSASYHLLRDRHGLPKLAFLGSLPAYIRDDPNARYI